MTTDQDLRSLLRDEAAGPTRNSADWNTVVRRGRHHRRVARVRAGVAIGGVTAVFAVVASGIVGGDASTTVVLDQPDTTTSSSATTSLTVQLAPRALETARIGNRLVTVTFAPEDPGNGVDTCSALAPSVFESEAEVLIGVGPAAEQTGSWVACRASAFSAWGTVELSAPLGERPLTDRESGARLSVVAHEDLLYPTALPAPYELDDHDEFSQATYESLPLGTWTFSWIVGDLALNISRWDADGEHPDGCGEGEPVEVRGSSGLLCSSTSSALLSWTDGRSFRTIELVDVSGEPLPQDIDLLEIADSLGPLD